jgi:hypothetical protein
VQWKEGVRTGLALYFLSTDFKENIIFQYRPLNQVAHSKFKYTALYGEYIIRKIRKGEVSAPVQARIGNLFYRYINFTREQIRTDKQSVFIVKPSLSAHNKNFHW